MKQPHNKFVFLISGTTATGKTDVAIQLGESLPIEIINADIGSFYTNLTIGTAKPDWKNQTISHHFFDVIDSTDSWTAPQFREKLEILVQEIWDRGNTPVIVGGSAFYIQAFFYKNHTLKTPTKELINSLEEQPVDMLWEELLGVDPVRAEKIGQTDHYRLVRALAIWHTQGQKPSDFKQSFNPIAPFYFLTLTRNRDQLYDMINQRVTLMMEAGWLDEVKTLLNDETWVDFMLKKKMIGYDLLTQYLLGYHADIDLDGVVDLIAQRTRNYAKRQITFLKKLQSNVKKESEKLIELHEVHEYNLTQDGQSDLMNFISEKIDLS